MKIKNVYSKMRFQDHSVLIDHEMTMSLQCNTVPPQRLKMILTDDVKIDCCVNVSIKVLQTLHLEYSAGYILLNILHIKEDRTHDNRMNVDIKT